MIRYFHRTLKSKDTKELVKYRTGAWVYVEAPAVDEVDDLVNRFKLDKGHLQDALDEDEMPRLEHEGDLVYIFTRFAYTNNDLQITTSPLLIVVGKSLFLTVSTRPIPKLSKFIDGKIDFSTTQRTKLLLQVLGQSVNQYEAFLNSISRQIKTIRHRLRIEKINNNDFIDFVLIEDELNEFLAALTPTNAILQRLLLGKHIKLYAEDQDIVEDLLLNNQQTIEGCKSSLKSVVNIREAYSTIMSNNLNRIIRILTVFTVLISVPTLIASVYGMNVRLPFADSPLAFSGVIGFSLLVSSLMLWVFKSKNWL